MQTKTDNYKTAAFLTTLLLSSTVALCMLFIISSCLCATTTYDDFCYFLLSKLSKQDRITFFKETILSEKKYRIVQISLFTISLLAILLTIYLAKRRNHIQQQLETFRKAVSAIKEDQLTFLSQLGTPIQIYLFMLFFIQFLFFTICAIQFPISYDEAWTYLNFTGKSILSSASYYPAPNNHIFFSVLTNIAHVIPISDPKIKMRFISILSSVLSSYIFFKLLTRFYSKKISLYTTALFTFSYPVALYSIQARGYEMLLLFSLIAIYTTVSYIQNAQRKYLVIYLLSIIAGFYTIPTFLYFFASLQLFILCHCLVTKQIALLKKFMIADLIAGFMVLILYAPVIFINGISAITENPYVKSISFSSVTVQLPAHLFYVLNWLWGLDKGGELLSVFLIIVLFGMLLQKGNTDRRPALLLMLLLILAPPVILLVQRVIPFERTWQYLVVPFFFSLCSFFSFISRLISGIRINRNIAFGILLTITIALLILKFPPDYSAKHHMDFRANELFSKVDPNRIHSIASNEVLMTDLLTYRIASTNKKAAVKIVKIADSSEIYADAIVLNNDSASLIKNLSDYTLITKNEYIQFYLKKENLN